MGNLKAAFDNFRFKGTLVIVLVFAMIVIMDPKVSIIAKRHKTVY